MCLMQCKILFFVLNSLNRFEGDNKVKNQCAEFQLADLNSHEESKSPPFSSFA